MGSDLTPYPIRPAIGNCYSQKRLSLLIDNRIRHAMFEMVMSRVLAIAWGHEDAIDLDRLRHDPLMKLAVGCGHADMHDGTE
jgi:hypothetical protein